MPDTAQNADLIGFETLSGATANTQSTSSEVVIQICTCDLNLCWQPL
jgi:hypothetical protein